MIKSQFITDILSLILDGNDFDPKLKRQINFISEKSRTHTGVGVFVYFNHSADVLIYKLDEDVVLNGLRIFSNENSLEAEVNLFTKDGIIDYIEILSFGDSYPNEDPKAYIMKQVWPGSARLEIKRGN
jgi:hypothetical protein